MATEARTVEVGPEDYSYVSIRTWSLSSVCRPVKSSSSQIVPSASLILV